MAMARVSKTSVGREKLDYGASRGSNQRQQYDQKRQEFGNSPWYGRNGESTPMPWSGPPGQERGQRAPFFTPDAADPRNAGYYAPENHSMDDAIAQAHAASRAAYNADPAYAQAAASGDLKGALARMVAMKQQGQQDRFVAQGGTPETWQGRYNPQNSWPVPHVPTGGGTPPPSGGGRTMPPAQTQSSAPTNNWADMALGRAGGAGVPMGGAGGQFGGYGGGITPQSMVLDRYPGGGNPYGGGNPFASTGASGLYNDPSLYDGGAMTNGRGIGPLLPPGFGGPRQPINPGGPTQFPINPYGRGGGNPMSPFQPGSYGGPLPNDLIGGMQMFGYQPYGGGYNPQMGNPFAALQGQMYY